MQTELIIILVLQALNILVSCCSPLILSLAHFIDRIRKSDCFGSSMELSEKEKINIKKSEVNEIKTSLPL